MSNMARGDFDSTDDAVVPPARPGKAVFANTAAGTTVVALRNRYGTAPLGKADSSDERRSK